MTDNQAKFERIAEQIETPGAASWLVPGVTYGVHIGGETFSGGSGITSIENPLPVTDETIFQIGSITKTVTATLILRLVEQGALALDARVRDYLPEFRVQDESVSERVTVRHLLTHMAGWTGDVFTDTGNNDDAMAEYVAQMQAFEQLAPLGAIFSYNNAAFAVAGRVIEALTGMSYEQAVKEMIFEPLELERSFFFPHEVMLHRFAVGHQVERRGEPKVLSPWAIPRGHERRRRHRLPYSGFAALRGLSLGRGVAALDTGKLGRNASSAGSQPALHRSLRPGLDDQRLRRQAGVLAYRRHERTRRLAGRDAAVGAGAWAAWPTATRGST